MQQKKLIKKHNGWRNYLDPLVLFLVAAILWELVVISLNIKPYLLPALSSVLKSMWVHKENLIIQSWITTQEVLFGFVLAVLAGVLLGSIIYVWPLMRRTIYPFIVVFQGVPKIALAPLMIIWFGYGDLSKILMAFLFAFFPVVIATMGGLEATPANLTEHFRSIRASGWITFRRLYVPSALPSIMDGCKQAMPLAVIGAIVGEFVGSEHGLGHLILNTTANAQTDYLFAALITVSIVAGLLYLIIELCARRIWWRGL